MLLIKNSKINLRWPFGLSIWGFEKQFEKNEKSTCAYRNLPLKEPSPSQRTELQKLRRCDGIGRREGFKIPCPQGRAGSTPATATTCSFGSVFYCLCRTKLSKLCHAGASLYMNVTTPKVSMLGWKSVSNGRRSPPKKQPRRSIYSRPAAIQRRTGASEA